jgi:hypothetical protein
MTAISTATGRPRKNIAAIQCVTYVAAEAIPQGSFVSIDNTSGLAYKSTDVATRQFVGIAAADTAIGGYVKCEYGHRELVACTAGVVYATTNLNVVVSDNNTVALATGEATNDRPVGTLVSKESATTCWIDVRVFGAGAS